MTMTTTTTNRRADRRTYLNQIHAYLRGTLRIFFFFSHFLLDCAQSEKYEFWLLFMVKCKRISDRESTKNRKKLTTSLSFKNKRTNVQIVNIRSEIDSVIEWEKVPGFVTHFCYDAMQKENNLLLLFNSPTKNYLIDSLFTESLYIISLALR